MSALAAVDSILSFENRSGLGFSFWFATEWDRRTQWQAGRNEKRQQCRVVDGIGSGTLSRSPADFWLTIANWIRRHGPQHPSGRSKSSQNQSGPSGGAEICHKIRYIGPQKCIIGLVEFKIAATGGLKRWPSPPRSNQAEILGDPKLGRFSASRPDIFYQGQGRKIFVEEKT